MLRWPSLDTFATLSETHALISDPAAVAEFFTQHVGLSFPGRDIQTSASEEHISYLLNDVVFSCDGELYHVGWRDEPTPPGGWPSLVERRRGQTSETPATPFTASLSLLSAIAACVGIGKLGVRNSWRRVHQAGLFGFVEMPCGCARRLRQFHRSTVVGLSGSTRVDAVIRISMRPLFALLQIR